MFVQLAGYCSQLCTTCLPSAPKEKLTPVAEVVVLVVVVVVVVDWLTERLSRTMRIYVCHKLYLVFQRMTFLLK